MLRRGVAGRVDHGARLAEVLVRKHDRGHLQRFGEADGPFTILSQLRLDFGPHGSEGAAELVGEAGDHLPLLRLEAVGDGWQELLDGVGE